MVVSDARLAAAERREESAAQKSVSVQLQLSKLRVALLLSGMFAASVLGRIAMQPIPSVEPIIPISVAAGMLFGIVPGVAMAGAAYFSSNFFVYGGQGFWTPFQVAGAAAATLLALLACRIFPKRLQNAKIIGRAYFFAALALSTLSYEFLVNVGWSLVMPMWLSFLTSLPFTLLHAASNGVFGTLIPTAVRSAGKSICVAQRPTAGLNSVFEKRLAAEEKGKP